MAEGCPTDPLSWGQHHPVLGNFASSSLSVGAGVALVRQVAGGRWGGGSRGGVSRRQARLAALPHTQANTVDVYMEHGCVWSVS